MSLHALAGHMATKGRGGDSMLVHMTPGEVRALQAMAERNGGTLTINPETGQPEANFLKKILPMVAGFALGPAGFGLMSAGMAGAAVGGITALSTGSLSRGLMAGLGAYGGASLGASLTNAGQGAIAAGDIAAQQAAGAFPTLAEGAGKEAIAKYATDVGALRDAALSKAGESGLGAKLSAGMGQMASNPGMYTREMMTGLATISPMVADQGVQTTTKRPDNAQIRNFTFDPYEQTYTNTGNYPASSYKGMAQGGIVALAAGGVSDADIQNWFKTNQGADDRTIASAMQQYGVSPDQLSSAMGFNPQEVAQRYSAATAPAAMAPAATSAAPTYTTQDIQNYLGANPGMTDAQIRGAMDQFGVGVDQMAQATGYDPRAIQQRYDMAADINNAQIIDYLGQQPNLTDRDIRAAMDQYGVGTAQMASATGLPWEEVQRRYEAAPAPAPAPAYTQYTAEDIGGYLAANPNADINAAIKEFNADPRAVNEYITGLTSGFTDPTATGSGSGTIDYYNKLVEKGIDAQELFGANQALNTDYTFDGNAGEEGIAALQKAFDVAETVKQFDPAGATQLEKDVEWVKLMDQEGFDAKDIARATGVSFNEVAEREAAARAALANVTTPVVEEPVVEQPVVEEPVVEEPVVEAPRLSATQNTTTTVEKPTDISTAPADAVPVGASGAGITTINPNKSVTTTPNVPGRPAGGFTGIEQLRKAYSDAGGSLGYVNPAPRTMQEFNQRFNTMTGDSKSAYDYLTGQGAYPTKSGVGQIMRPYSEATLGIPAAEGNPTQKFIYDPATRSYRENPNYTPVTYSSTGERTTGLSQNAVRSGFNALPPTSDDAAIYAWMQANNITPEQLSAAINAPLDEVRSRIKAVKDQEKKAAEEAAATPFIQGDANGGLMRMAAGGYAVGGGLGALAGGGAASQYNLGGYSDGGRLLRGPGDGVSDSIPATIGGKQPARLADGEFVVPARIVSELGNGSTEAGARKLYAMMDRVQKARGKTTGKNRVAANTRSDKYLPA